MKTPIYNPGTMKIIQILTVLFGLQSNFLFAANPIKSDPLNRLFVCVTCSNSAPAIQNEEAFNELILLAPTPPAEATFSDEEVYIEINLTPTTPAEASFNDDPEIISKFNLEYLSPTTPAAADFND